jgi:hypothetical protein
MKRYFLLAVVLALPSFAFSQAIPFEQKGPVGSFTASASYIYGEAQSGNDYNLIGWTATPELNLVKHFGLQADFSSYYMQSVYPGQSRLIMTAGPRYNLKPRSRISPYIFGEGGETRLSFQRTLFIDWEPTARAGIGLDYRVSRGIALTLIPGEFIGHENLNGAAWSEDYGARAGITFNLFH